MGQGVPFSAEVDEEITAYLAAEGCDDKWGFINDCQANGGTTCWDDWTVGVGLV